MSMNDQMLAALIRVVNAEIRLFHRLLELLRDEGGSLVADDLTGLEASLDAQQEVVSQARRLEQERLRLVQALSRAHQDRAGQGEHGGLVQVLQGSGDQELARLRHILLELGRKVRDTNARNASLIRQSLRCPGRGLNILNGQLCAGG
jgi:flagellar biosynthesis/type III secretory pathway chaperone